MGNLGEAFALMGILAIGWSLILFTPLWAPQLVFRKLAREPRHRDESAIPTFYLSDGFVLVTFMACASALAGALRHETSVGWVAGLTVCTNCFVLLFWIMCQRFMQQHRIYRPGARLLMQTLLYPLSVLVVGTIVGATLMLVRMLEVFTPGSPNAPSEYVSNPVSIAAGTMLVLSVALLMGLRSLFKRFIVPCSLASQATVDHESPDA